MSKISNSLYAFLLYGNRRAGGSSATRVCPFAFTSLHRALSVQTTTPPSSRSVCMTLLSHRRLRLAFSGRLRLSHPVNLNADESLRDAFPCE